jgi:putative tryptophan/tyrosine transport system substrate-binding protein
VLAAARDLGVSLVFANASNLVEIDQAFANFASERVDALFVSADGFLLTHSDHIVALATRSGMPAIYGWRQAVTLGGLMSYGTNFPDGHPNSGSRCPLSGVKRTST